MGLSSELFCEAGSFSDAASTTTGVFSQWFEALFSHAGTLGCAVCHRVLQLLRRLLAAASPASCSFAHPAPQSTTSQGLPSTAALRGVLSAHLPVSYPPSSLGECFFFNSLVVGLPYSSIFCQFWLFFVFKLLSVLWLGEEAQCVYLCLHLGRKWKLVFLSEALSIYSACICLLSTFYAKY